MKKYTLDFKYILDMPGINDWIRTNKKKSPVPGFSFIV